MNAQDRAATPALSRTERRRLVPESYSLHKILHSFEAFTPRTGREVDSSPSERRASDVGKNHH